MAFLRRLILAAAVLLAAGPASANFHLWLINELYSNADGTVQYVEFRSLTSGQQFVKDHALVASQNGVGQSFNIPSDLPGDSSGKFFLIATQGFADLGIVTPDYIVPNFFFPLGNGNLNWADADIWNYSGLPADRVNSLQRDGTAARNSPTNFAGKTGTIGANYQGLWWRSPAGQESGWGINLAHQGDILFATWFTYDTDGSGMWLVMSRVARTAEGTYSGDIYRTTGPAFSANPWSSNGVVQTLVGSGTFTFTSVNEGRFDYSVNGVVQTKPITRLIFSSPVPVCSSGGDPPAIPNYQDLWWRSPAGSESGWGVNIAHQGDILFATWFTYGTDGKGMWLVGSKLDKTGAATYSGPLYRTTGPAFSANPWNSSGVAQTAVGTATFSFSDANNGTFAYSVNGTAQSKPITRLIFGTPMTICR